MRHLLPLLLAIPVLTTTGCCPFARANAVRDALTARSLPEFAEGSKLSFKIPSSDLVAFEEVTTFTGAVTEPSGSVTPVWFVLGRHEGSDWEIISGYRQTAGAWHPLAVTVRPPSKP